MVYVTTQACGCEPNLLRGPACLFWDVLSGSATPTNVLHRKVGITCAHIFGPNPYMTCSSLKSKQWGTLFLSFFARVIPRQVLRVETSPVVIGFLKRNSASIGAGNTDL